WLMPTDIHLPPKIGVSHLHIFEEGVFCRKMIKINTSKMHKIFVLGVVCDFKLMGMGYRQHF
ncbi:hypothetical protein, partial [Bacillus toyonensis]|uniref:hypothetical protein n=1 Tax=Bacillus toyonensis TaxID=155322 RepID=UPI0036EC190B